jgi:hypothetical protein
MEQRKTTAMPGCSDKCNWIGVKFGAFEEVPPIPTGKPVFQVYTLTMPLSVLACYNEATKYYLMGKTGKIGYRCEDHVPTFESWTEISFEDAIVIEVMNL